MIASLRHIIRAVVQLSVVLLVAVGFSACEEDVVAVTGTENPFSLYGVISPQLDSQWVRVFPIEDRLVPAEPDQLDARIVSTDLTTGVQRVWEDSVIVDFANQYAHAFWAPFRAEFGHSYRIEAQRTDGAVSSVEVTVPQEAEVELRNAQVQASSVIAPVFVNKPVPSLLQVEVDYAISYRPHDQVDIISDVISIPYVLEHFREDDGWIIPVDLERDFDEISARLFRELDVGIDQRVGIILLNLTVRFIVGNEEWSPPDGVFDPELIVQPGVLRNVENGFGFVGAGYRLQRVWTPQREAIVEAGFRPPEET